MKNFLGQINTLLEETKCVILSNPTLEFGFCILVLLMASRYWQFMMEGEEEEGNGLDILHLFF